MSRFFKYCVAKANISVVHLPCRNLLLSDLIVGEQAMDKLEWKFFTATVVICIATMEGTYNNLTVSFISLLHYQAPPCLPLEAANISLRM